MYAMSCRYVLNCFDIYPLLSFEFLHIVICVSLFSRHIQSDLCNNQYGVKWYIPHNSSNYKATRNFVLFTYQKRRHYCQDTNRDLKAKIPGFLRVSMHVCCFWRDDSIYFCFIFCMFAFSVLFYQRELKFFVNVVSTRPCIHDIA